MFKHFKGFKGEVSLSRFPTNGHINIFPSQSNKSDCRGFYSVRLLLRGNDNCLHIKIFLNGRHPEKSHENDEENSMKNQMGAKLNCFIAIFIFAFFGGNEQFSFERDRFKK